MRKKQKLSSPYQALTNYLPEGTFDLVETHLVRNGVALKISRPRLTKLGDYRPPHRRGEPHKISVNGDMNPYAFVVTLVHEIAHLYTYKTYGRRVKPHGNEWKSYFKQLMQPIMARDVFPESINSSLNQYLDNPAASSCTDESLYLALDQFNTNNKEMVRVGDLDPGRRFLFRKRVFKLEHKLRKRYRCIEESTQRPYNFSALAEVTPLHEK